MVRILSRARGSRSPDVVLPTSTASSFGEKQSTPMAAAPSVPITIGLAAMEGCPFAEATRLHLRQAMDELGLSGPIDSVRIHLRDTPTNLPSPTILIDGVPVGFGRHRAGRWYRGLPLARPPRLGEIAVALQRAIDLARAVHTDRASPTSAATATFSIAKTAELSVRPDERRIHLHGK